MKTLLLSLLLLGATVAVAEPVYDSDDMQLEGMLAELKDNADEGDLADMRQVYLHYGFAGKQEQANAWAKKFLDTLRERAEQGDVAAMSNLARAYQAGDAVISPNPVQAAAWLSRASAAGDAASAYMLGEMLAQQGQEAEAKVAYARAYGLFRQRAEQGNTEARYWMGFMELRGIGTEKPQNSAATLAALVENDEFLPAAYQLFKYAAEQEDDALAFRCARLLADKGQDPQMAYFVADAAYHGRGTEPDEELASRYLQQAVEAGCPAALYHRAWQLEDEGKLEDAFKMFADAAAAGHDNALVKAGVMQLEGKGCEKDEATGLQYLQRATDVLNSPFAPWELGRYYDSIGERSLADSYYITASDRGLAPAMARRGLLHLLPGSGVDWSPTEAYRWWTRGAEAEDEDCLLYRRLYLYLFIPLLVVLVFSLPMLLARYLLRRKSEN